MTILKKYQGGAFIMRIWHPVKCSVEEPIAGAKKLSRDNVL